MDVSNIQKVLADLGCYSGAIDGKAGPKTWAAVASAERALAGRYPRAASSWPEERRLVAAAQVALAQLGFEPGAIDGYAGHNTAEAFSAWAHVKANGRREHIDRTPVGRVSEIAQNLPRQSECAAFYGRPGAEIEARLVRARLPFAMRLDWALDQTVDAVTLHQLAAPSYVGALESVRDHYGLERLRQLGIDRFAGGYVHRRMRGGSSWSMHAYGCAVDHFAAPNGLRVSCPQALFCGADYKAFLDIMEDAGWLPAVRLWGRDAMHFQRARMG